MPQRIRYYPGHCDREAVDQYLYGDVLSDRPCRLCRWHEIAIVDAGEESFRCSNPTANFGWAVNSRAQARECSSSNRCGRPGRLFEPIAPIVISAQSLRTFRSCMLGASSEKALGPEAVLAEMLKPVRPD